MDHGQRRIRCLTLRGGVGAPLAALRTRLEEAFRVASLTALPPNAQVVVRKLDLGRVRSDISPKRLAERISTTVRNLSASAVPIESPSAARACVVWFSDPLQPYLVLLARLLDDGAVGEWYWRSLFPTRALAADSETIEWLFVQACAKPLGALGPAHLLRLCLQPQRCARLLPLIAPSTARRVLHELGLSPSAARIGSAEDDSAGSVASVRGGEREPVVVARLGGAWRDVLGRAERYWGARDVRWMWMAFHALILHQPSLLQRPDLLHRIALRGSPEADARQQLPLATDGSGPSTTRSSAAQSAEGPSAVTAMRTTPAVAPPAAATEPVGRSRAAEAAAAVVTAPQASLLGADAGQWTAGWGTSPSGTVLPRERRRAADAQSASDNVASDLRGGAALNRGGGPARRAAEPGVCAESRVVFSPSAGFALLVPLLQRVGMSELTSRHDILADVDLPREVLLGLARRFELDAEDPVWGLFQDFESQSQSVVETFAAPESWWHLADCTRRTLERCLLPGGRTMILASGGRWPLWIGQARGPRVTVAIRDGEPWEREVVLSDLVTSVQLVCAARLRRLCAMAMRALVRRAGRVFLTQTHWDAIFDIQQTDLRLRRVALDTDPGWVPWLGKVVQFHFDSDGQRYA